MQGRHIYQPKLFSFVTIESLIPQNHLLRKIDQILSFAFVREMTASYYSSRYGRPSIDPELFFRMMVVGYFYGISSDRQLCEELTYNLAYRWFCRLSLEDKIPEHSSLTRIRDRFGEEVFSQFFDKVVKICQEKGLVKGESLMTDSTLIKANASLDSLAPTDPQAKPEIKKGNGLTPPPNRKISNATHQSITDPEATLAYKKGTLRSLKYKVHNSIDSDSRVILDCFVTTGAYHDSQAYISRIEHILKTFGLNLKEVIADRAYGSASILSTLASKKIEAYIPLFSGRSGRASPLPESGFVYDTIKDQFTCAEGNVLLPYPKTFSDRKRYRTKAVDCITCTQQMTCLGNVTKKEKVRYVDRNIYQLLYEEVKEKMRTSNFIQKLTERMWKMEGIIAEAKNQHNLQSAKYRGRAKVQIQAYLTATVQNVKRLLEVGTKKPLRKLKTCFVYLFFQAKTQFYSL